jgi:hypothetical protein
MTSYALFAVALLLALAPLALVLSVHAASNGVYAGSLSVTLALGVIGVTSLVTNAAISTVSLPLGLPWLGAHFRIDALAAFFLVVVNLGGAAASLFAVGYSRHEKWPRRVLPFYPAYLAAMNLVVLADDAFTFLVAWEFMSLMSWALVIAHHQERENLRAPWRDVLRVLRRLEARGEVRGGRFVGGFSGEQYALPEAIGLLRSARKEGERGALVAVSAADPLNLVGLIVPGEPVPAFASNRILYRDGVPVAVKEGEGRAVRMLVETTPEEATALEAALIRKQSAPLVRAYLGKRR